MTHPYILFILIPCFARLCYTDIKDRELEHIFIFALIPCAFFTDVPMILRIAGAIIPFALFRLIGFGDVLLLAVLGSVFGIYGLFGIFALASICSGMVSMAGLLLGKVKKEDSLPFAPYICSSCLLFVLKELFFL